MSDVPALLQRAAQLIKANRTEEARALLTDITDAKPHDVDAWYLLSFVLEDVEQQLSVLNLALKLKPDHALARKRLAKLQPDQLPSVPSDSEARSQTNVPSMSHSAHRFTRIEFLALGVGLLFTVILLGAVVIPAATFTATALPTTTEAVAAASSSTASSVPGHTPTRTPSNTLTLTPSPTAPWTSTPTDTPSATPTATDTATPIPSSPVPTTADQAQPPNLCVDIASDSNGYGQITLELPTNGNVGVIFVQPLWAVLQDQLNKLDLGKLKVLDHSFSAASLTNPGRTNYFTSLSLTQLVQDRCKYIAVGPFLDDILYDQSTPQRYVQEIAELIDQLRVNNPGSVIFVLGYYQVSVAKFVSDQPIYAGFRTDRIAAFNAELTAACQSDNTLGHYEQVLCVDTQSLFADLGATYIDTSLSKSGYLELVDLTRTATFVTQVQQFYDANPNGLLIGDGFHLSLAGRVRLMATIAQQIFGNESNAH